MIQVDRIENITKSLLDDSRDQEEQVKAFRALIEVAFEDPLDLLIRVMHLSRKQPAHDVKSFTDGLLAGIAMKNLAESDEFYSEFTNLVNQTANKDEDTILQ